MVIERLFEDWDPFRELAKIQQRIGQMLEGASMPRFRQWLSAGAFPPVNVYTTDQEVVVAAELPGVEPSEVDVSVVGGVLTLRGKRPREGGEGVTYLRRERTTGEFSRSVNLPEEVDTGKGQAHYQKGILTVVFPRAEEAKPRKIPVQTQ